jgi:UPF0042 nucleotide-binding protein
VKTLLFSSFGFKYGVPGDANYVFDVRFIPNPFYVAELRPLSGRDEPVRRYIRSLPEAEAFLAASVSFLDFVIPRCLDTDGKSLHVAVGCTGGRHRSVAFAEWFFERYAGGSSFGAEVRHRDVDRVREA